MGQQCSQCCKCTNGLPHTHISSSGSVYRKRYKNKCKNNIWKTLKKRLVIKCHQFAQRKHFRFSGSFCVINFFVFCFKYYLLFDRWSDSIDVKIYLK